MFPTIESTAGRHLVGGPPPEHAVRRMRKRLFQDGLDEQRLRAIRNAANVAIDVIDAHDF